MTDKIEDTEIEVETVTTQDKKEKQFSQDEVNKLLAKERREHKAKLDTLQSEYDTYKADKEAKEAELTEKNKAKVEALKKDLPEQVVKLLDKLSIQEQLEYLEDPENKIVIEKKTIPETPKGRERDSKPQMTLPITF